MAPLRKSSRKSTRAAPRNQILAGIDLGGTSMKLLIVDSRNNILADAKAPTRRSKRPTDTLDDIAGLFAEAIKMAGLKRRDLSGISIGAPGKVDRHRGVVHEAPNLGWLDYPLGPQLEKRVRIPVIVENDVNVGTVGEHVLGAGENAQDMVGIFVGTGIGGGIIANGRLYEGSHGGAGEVGHMMIVIGGPMCGCGHRGCAEAVASRTAMEREVRAALKAGQKSVIPELMKKKSKLRMTSSVVNAALKRKDPLMREVLARAERYLGMLAANVINLLDPECVVIGGGLASRLGEIYVGPIRQWAYKYMFYAADAKRIRIVPGRLGDNAGALGAVVLARQRLA